MTVNKDINKDRGDNIKRKALSSANRCSVCFTEGLTEAHHIVPVSLGGPSILSNLVELCLSCHDKVHNQRAGWREKHVLVSKLPRLGVSTEGDLLVWTTTR